MSFARLHKVVAYLAAGLGLAALSLGTQLDRPVLALVFVGFAASWFVEGPILERPGYARFLNVVVLAGLGLQVVRASLGAPWLTLGIEYAALLQLSRLFHRRSAREYQHIAVLAFLHLIAATVLTNGLDYAFVFLGFVIVTPWMLALTHLRTEIEENYANAVIEGSDDHLTRVLRSRRLAGSGFLIGTALLAVPLFLVTAGLFLLFPRVGMGFLSFQAGPGQRVAGFGRNVTLGGFGLIRDDPTVVMRVKVPMGDRSPPDHIPLRLRGTSFDRYDGREWTRTPERVSELPHVFDRYAIVRWPKPEDVELSIVLDPLDEPVVFLPEGTVALSVPPRVRSGRNVGRRLVRAPGLDIRYVDGDGLGLNYTTFVTGPRALPSVALSPEARDRYLQIPADHERVVGLAHRVAGDGTAPVERARRILRFLRSSGRFRYSLHQPDVGDRAPLDVFLFDARRGHCEYFSTAMAIMLRAVGIPSRNVTGFVGGRYNRFGGYYAIREGDAHSWVEAYLGDRWVTFDPTPPARDAVGPGDGPLESVRALLDAMRTRWASHVVGYDLRNQVTAFRRFMRWAGFWRVRHVSGPGGATPEPDADALSALRGGDRGLWLIGLALLVLWAGLFTARWWRGRRKPSADAAVKLYRELERRLDRAARPRPSHVTPLQHARDLQAERFTAAETVRDITDAYLAARYGGAALEPQRLERLRAELRRIV